MMLTQKCPMLRQKKCPSQEGNWILCQAHLLRSYQDRHKSVPERGGASHSQEEERQDTRVAKALPPMTTLKQQQQKRDKMFVKRRVVLDLLPPAMKVARYGTKN